MANYNINIQKSFMESKRNAYDMGQDGNQSYIISTFAILNNISESKSKLVIHNYLFDKFLESESSNFDSFLFKQMKYKKEDTMTGADIPQNVRPEKPIDDKEEYDESLYYMKEEDEEENDSDTDDENEEYDIEEEDDSDTSEEEDDSLENDSSDNKGQSKLTSVILEFMDDTHLSEASEDEAKLFLSRFKGVLQEVIDNEYAVQLIILLLYKAKFEPDNLSDGEIEELEDICFTFNNQMEESDTSKDEEQDDESDTIEESYTYKSLFEVESTDLETTDKESNRIDKKKANRNKRKQKKAFNRNVSNTRLAKKGIDTIGKDAKQGVISKTKELYDKYPITTCLVGGAVLLGAGTIAIAGWYALTKLSNKKYNKAKERLINDNTIDDIVSGNIRSITDNIIEADVIPDKFLPTSDTSNDEQETQDTSSTDETGVDDAPESSIDPIETDGSDTSLDTNIDTDEDDESDTSSDEEQDIDIEDDNTRVELDSDTMNEIEDFDLDIEEIQSNESEIKSELVSQTKEELNNNPELKQQIDNRNKKKREYVKTNKDYWGKDKVSQDKDKKSDTSKDKKKPEIVNKDNKKGDTSNDKNKKKPIEKKGSMTMGSAKKKDTKSKPSDTSKDTKKKSNVKEPIKKSDTKKPIEKKGNTSNTKKKPDVKQPVKKSDTSGDTKPKPNENVDAYKKRTGKGKLPAGYYKDKNNRIQIDKKKIKKKESYENEYKFLIF